MAQVFAGFNNAFEDISSDVVIEVKYVNVQVWNSKRHLRQQVRIEQIQALDTARFNRWLDVT
jgi:hypothetical protein